MRGAFVLQRQRLPRLRIDDPHSPFGREFDHQPVFHIAHRQIVRHEGALMVLTFGQDVLPEKA